jgi:hypothetical protein
VAAVAVAAEASCQTCLGARACGGSGEVAAAVEVLRENYGVVAYVAA